MWLEVACIFNDGRGTVVPRYVFKLASYAIMCMQQTELDDCEVEISANRGRARRQKDSNITESGP